MRNYLKLAAACLAAFSLASCSSWSPAPETDASKYELKGDVVSVRSIPYKVDSTADGYRIAGIDPMAFNIYMELNGDGNATLLRRYNSKGEPLSEETFTYNGDGQLKESRLVSVSTGELAEKTVCIYRKGRLYTKTVTDASDSIKKSEVYEYFGNDSIRMTCTFKGDTPSLYNILSYDGNGKLTSNIMYSMEGKKLTEFKMMYDSLGRRDSVYSDSFLFGKMGNKVKYNDNGNCVAITFSGEGGRNEMRFDLKLDSCGNWIEKYTYKNGGTIPVRIEKREIKYSE